MKDNCLWWNKDDIRTEQQQLTDEGCDISSVEAEFMRLRSENMPEDDTFQKAANALMDKARLLPKRTDYRYIEPSDLETIRSQRANGPRKLVITDSEALQRDRIHGALLGRIAGCFLGKPVEGTRRIQMQKMLERANCQEIPDYLWCLPGLTEKDYQDLDIGWWWHTYRRADSFPGDDDINYTVMAMALIKHKGIGFTPTDMADFWMGNIPISRTYSAERVAYRNFINNVEPPESAVYRNPFREWIGAQIRGDFFGYLALGQPEFAAELAWRDASISHVKNGIYGEMWVAAMLAAAMTQTDVRRVIEIGLTEIPEKSRLHEAVTDIINRHAAGDSYFATLDYIHQRWDEYWSHHWCHTISNAQIVTMGLLYGEGDYEKAITRAVLTCFDTDCNGATVGSIMGMMLGANAIPEKWTGVMNDTLHTDLPGYQTSKISQLAEEMFQLYHKLGKANEP